MDSQVAVKAVIQRSDGKFLIVREAERWQAVGGRLEKGEKLEDGLKREAQEETGIEGLKIGPVIHVDEWFAKPEGETKHIVALFYLCEVDMVDVILSDEHEEFAWVSVEDLNAYGDRIEAEIKKAINAASKLIQ